MRSVTTVSPELRVNMMIIDITYKSSRVKLANICDQEPGLVTPRLIVTTVVTCHVLSHPVSRVTFCDLTSDAGARIYNSGKGDMIAECKMT